MSRSSKRMAQQIFQLLHYNLISVVVLVLLLVKETRSAASNSIVKSKHCQEKCGDVKVPYPFGIGKGCYRNEMFEVTCHNHSFPFYLDSQLFEISMDYVRLDVGAVVECHNKSSGESFLPNGIRLWLRETLRVSHTQNKLVAIGCDIFAYITDLNTTNYRKGCASICHNNTSSRSSSSSTVVGSSCTGIGCCQTDIPEDPYSFDLHVETINTIGRLWASNPCSIAFIADKNFSEFSKLNTSNITDFGVLPGVPLVLDWAIENITCHEAQRRKDYACGLNSDCIESIFEDGVVYRCRCSKGYQGNPYLKNGCQVIDQCKDPTKEICPKDALCFNTAGKYSCKCKPGFHNIHGDGTNCIPDKELFEHISLGIGIAIGVLVLIAIGLWSYLKLKKRQKNRMKQKFFRRNGGLLLQQQISSTKGSVVKTKLFIAEELEKATDNFNESRILGKGGLGTVYKGMLSDGSIVAVKKSNIVDENQVGQFINEVIILSQIIHRNIVKLLGCCLETEVPLLVYEYVSNGTLSLHLHDEGHVSTMSWNTRLRIHYKKFDFLRRAKRLSTAGQARSRVSSSRKSRLSTAGKARSRK